MKIVILDSYAENPGDLSWDWLKDYGGLTVYERTPAELIPDRSEGADIIITNKTPLRREILEMLPELKYVALESTGYNVVDTEYLRSRGIPVSNIPAYSTNAVTQLVFAFILEFANNVGLHSASVHAGDWTSCADFCYWKAPMTELAGKKLAVIGYGRIGSAVAKAANGFGMEVLASTAHPQRHMDAGVTFRPLDECLEQADFITFHTPLTPETEGWINRDMIAKMKPGAFVINTSRGQAVNEQDLADALNSGRLAGAGVDVLSTEPPKKDNPLLTAKNCFITPHIAWAPFETRVRLMDILKKNIAAFTAGSPINTVN